MIVAVILSFLTICTSISPNRTIHLNLFTQEDLTNNWQTISEDIALSTELIIASGVHTQHTLMKVLSLNMTQLQYHFDRSTPISTPKVYDSPQYLTPKLVRTIFNSAYFPQLTQLNLINTNIDDRYFQIGNQNRQYKPTLNLKSLKLGSNYISAPGFDFLSRYYYPNLKELDVSGTSLLEQQSIDSLLKIICSQSGQTSCRTSLESLDISSTNIQRQGFTKIMQSLNTSSLKYLNISNNNLHQNQQYQNGANLTAFQLLTQLDLQGLIQLQMNDMAIDQEFVRLFKKWKLQSLQSLVLFANFIDDSVVMEWITSQNFPSLQRLILYNNYLTDSSLRHIREQHFKLRELNVGFNQFTHQGLQQLVYLSNGLEKLFLKNMKLQSKYLHQFFKAADLDEIEQLGFSGNNQIGDLFSYFPWQATPKLQKLVLTDCNIKKSVAKLIQEKEALAQSLKLLLLNNTGLTSIQTLALLQNLHTIFPELQFIDLIQPYLQPLNFSQLITTNISQKLVADIGYVCFWKQRQKIVLLKLSNLGLLALTTLKDDLSEYFEFPPQLAVNLNKKINKTIVIPDLLCEQLASKMVQLFDFSSLRTLVIKNMQQLQLLLSIATHHTKNQFLSLQFLLVLCEVTISDAINLLQIGKLSKLKLLKLSVLIDEKQKQLNSLMLLLKRLYHLTSLSLSFVYKRGNKNKYNFNVYLNQLNFPFLQTLQLSESQLKAQEIGGIIHSHKYSLRNINFNNNFLQTSFIHILPVHELVLTSIDLSFISFTLQQFVKLADLNTLHLKTLKLPGCDLTSDHIVSLLHKTSSNRTFLPSLVTLLLNDNDIAEEGVKALFQNGLHQLSYLKINRNYNPNYLNIILSYPNKLHQISVIGTDVYALSRQLSPAATRRVNYLSIATNDFELSDFQVLGSLQYRKLVFSHIMIKDVYQCELLINLLKINRYTSKIALFIDNDKQGLNSSCLRQQFTEIQVGSDVEQLLITDKHYTTFIPQFLELVLRSLRYLKSLMLYKTKAPPQIFLSIDPERIQNIQIINIPQNYMNDQAFQLVLTSPLQSLTFLDVSENQITMQSFSKLRERELPLVEQINFSGLPIGNEGLQVISSMKLPRLKRLFLMNCQITELDKLSKFVFPNLLTLGLQRNSINFYKIVGFLRKLNKNYLPKLQNISFKGITLMLEQYEQILELATKFNLRIQLDHPYYLEHRNGAKY